MNLPNSPTSPQLPRNIKNINIQTVQSHIESILNPNVHGDFLHRLKQIQTHFNRLKYQSEQYYQSHPRPFYKSSYIYNIGKFEEISYDEIFKKFADTPEILQTISELQELLNGSKITIYLIKEILKDSLLSDMNPEIEPINFRAYTKTLDALNDAFTQPEITSQKEVNELKASTKLTLPHAEFKVFSDYGYANFIKHLSQITTVEMMSSMWFEQAPNRIISGFQALNNVDTLSVNFDFLNQSRINGQRELLFDFLNQISSLTLEGYSPEVFTTHGYNLIPALQKVRVLKLSKINILGGDKEIISSFLASLPQLQHLGFSWDPWNPLQHHFLQSLPSSIPNLTSLALYCFHQHGKFNIGFEHINFPHLKYLEIDAKVLIQHSPGEIKKGLSNLTELQHFVVNDFSGLFKEPELLKASSEGAENIESLSLIYHDNPILDAPELLSYIASFGNLKTLAIGSFSGLSPQNTLDKFKIFFSLTMHIPYLILPHDAMKHLPQESIATIRELISKAPNKIIV